MFRFLTMVSLLILVAGCSQNQAAPKIEPADQAQVIQTLEKSFVAVEYTLQKDGADQPEANGVGMRCPNCGGYHGSSVGNVLREERPLELEGYLVSPTRVILSDPGIHPRFIKSLEVRHGDSVSTAKPVAWAREQYALVLELDKPLEGAVPLAFDAEAEGPYFFAMQTLGDSEPSSTMAPFAPSVIVRNGSESLRSVEHSGLIVNAEGNPVGMVYNPEQPIDDAWKGSPLEWDLVEQAEMERIDARVREVVENNIVRVEMIFRSPSGEDDSYRYHRYRGGDDNFEGTEANVAGLLWDKQTLLVLGDLKPANTARLEQLRVHTKDGAVLKARFKASLKDLPVLVATLDEPFDHAFTLYSSDLAELRHHLAIAANVKIVGDSREIRTLPQRIAGFEKGQKGEFFPVLNGADDIFLFTSDGKLAIFPGGFRDKPWVESWYGSDELLMSATMLADQVADLQQYADAANVPLSEEEENRLAWLGVQLQSLNPELARANNVALETKNGRIGALVTEIYPNSPAAEADIQPGAILLSLQVKGEPNPVQIEYEDSDYGFGQMFPWDRLDELPEEYFGDLPSPFPSVENSFNRILTNLGEGKDYTLNMVVNGEKVSKDLTVEFGPAHYKSAKRTENKAVGLNARNLTFEVRRYIKLQEDDPGVVISKVEPGSKAAVAGIKPYELLTQVNGKPIQHIEDFDSAMSQPGEYKLTIKRMAKTRVVTITLEAADFEKKDEPEEEEME